MAFFLSIGDISSANIDELSSLFLSDSIKESSSDIFSECFGEYFEV